MHITSELRRRTSREFQLSAIGESAMRLLPHETTLRQRVFDDLRKRVRAALDDSNYRVLRAVEIDAHEGLVTLKGTVGSYYQKQVATTVVLPLDGVEELRNELCVSARRVSDPDSRRTESID